MGKLHQHLAVEDSKQSILRSTLEEAIQTFSKRGHLMEGHTIVQTSKLNDDDPLYPEYPNSTYTKPVAETVMGKINWVLEHAKAYYDLSAQKDVANCQAKADLVINGKTILSDVPAITLLFIENKLKAVRNMIAQATTLDAAKNWSPHKAQENVWECDPEERTVKQKITDHVVVVPAQDKHPAQVREVQKEAIRAIRKSTNLSGFIQTKEKAELLMRCDELIQAAKQARQTANDQEVNGDVRIAEPLFNYLLNGE